MRAVANANDELRGVFTVDWNQPAPDGSGKPLIPNEVVHALVQHFDEHDLSNRSVPPDVLDAEADVSALEREIDQLIYGLYGLTPEEIQIVGAQSNENRLARCANPSRYSYRLEPRTLPRARVEFCAARRTDAHRNSR
jgi:hypothetical protein